jgi:hypothetical protein
MSTAQEIESAIRSLSPTERDKLARHIPQLFPEIGDKALVPAVREAEEDIKQGRTVTNEQMKIRIGGWTGS